MWRTLTHSDLVKLMAVLPRDEEQMRESLLRRAMKRTQTHGDLVKLGAVLLEDEEQMRKSLLDNPHSVCICLHCDIE